MGELVYHRKAVQRLEGAMAAIGQSIKMFEPEFNLRAVKPIQRRQARYFRHGECTRMVLEILRESDSPLDTRAIADAVIRVKLLDPVDVDLQVVYQTVANVLKGLAQRKVVVRTPEIGGGNAWGVAT